MGGGGKLVDDRSIAFGMVDRVLALAVVGNPDLGIGYGLVLAHLVELA